MIVTLSDALIQRLAANDRRILRDRVLSGFCLRMNKRTRTFMVATSASGKQVRLTIGRWPIFTTEQARAIASNLLKDCRTGNAPIRPKSEKLLTLRQLLPGYAQAKGLKESSLKRYESILNTHFHEWQDCNVSQLNSHAFSTHCHDFSQAKGTAIVEVGRGLIGAIFKYINAVHGFALKSPFNQLAAAGLMNQKTQPRERRLQESGLVEWYAAAQSLQEKQRDVLMLLAMTGLRRNEGGMLKKWQIDMQAGIVNIPDTKTGQPHSLPITPIMNEIFERRIHGLSDDQLIFEGVSLEHLAEMATRAGAPKFMLHDLRKMLATAGERLGYSDAILRRILNHRAKRSDTLHRHYVRVSAADIHDPLVAIQQKLLALMRNEQGGGEQSEA
jgi:hypothetical protein